MQKHDHSKSKRMLVELFPNESAIVVKTYKQVRVMHTPYTALLYSKNRVYRGIRFIFLIFALKHRLWVLVYPKSMF